MNMTGRKIIPLLTVAAVILTVAAALAFPPSNQATRDGPRLAGQMRNFELADRPAPGPDLSWSDGDGRIVRIGDFKGKIVLLNFWSSWCAPCRRELPGLDRLQAKLAGDDFTAIALNIDQDGQGNGQEDGKAVAVRVANQLNLKHLKLNLDPENKTVRTLGLRFMPTSYLFDRDGKILGTMVGDAEWDSAEAIRLLNYYINRRQ